MPIVRDALDLPAGDCGCGVACVAEYHTELIVEHPQGRNNITDVQLYHCAAHVREYKPGDVYGSDGWGDSVVLESTTTHLRGDV